MSLPKQSVDISFAKTLDTKTDPKRVSAGKFLSLKNAIFTHAGEIIKRNGYSKIANVSSNLVNKLALYNGTLVGIGSGVFTLSPNQGQGQSSAFRSALIFNPEAYYNLALSTAGLARPQLGVVSGDVVIDPITGLAAFSYSDGTRYYMGLADSQTGALVLQPFELSSAVSQPKLCLIGSWFIGVYIQNNSGTFKLTYQGISTQTFIQGTYIVDSTVDTSSVATSFDIAVANNTLFMFYNNHISGTTHTAVRTATIKQINTAFSTGSNGASNATTLFTGSSYVMSVCIDNISSNPILWLFYHTAGQSVSGNGHLLGYTYNSGTFTLTIPDQGQTVYSSQTVSNLTSVATSIPNFPYIYQVQLYYEVVANYGYGSSIPNHSVHWITRQILITNSVFSSGSSSITIRPTLPDYNSVYFSIFQSFYGANVFDLTTPNNISSGTTVSGITTTNLTPNIITLSSNTAGSSATTPGDLIQIFFDTFGTFRSGAGLASKAFVNPLASSQNISWFKGEPCVLISYQSSLQPTYFLLSAFNLAGRLAYSNGGGYLTYGLPMVSVINNTAYFAYLNKDLIQPQGKLTNIPGQPNQIYSSLGLNLGKIGFDTESIQTATIANTLQMSGMFLWNYDGTNIFNNNFNLYPDNLFASTTTTGGSITAQTYFYQAVYRWTDAQGNIHRSAPSVPLKVDLTSAGTSTNVITLDVPNPRFEQGKIGVITDIYRWSTAQQIYYYAGSTTPINSDYENFVDTFSDTSIIGNEIIYTNGGLIEDIGPPATSLISIFNTRVWMVDSEDPNLLWFSKQVIESTPVEMSDLLTFYVPPNTGSPINSGPITALYAMDDKLIIFKPQAINYIYGTGPDNTGNNNGYSDSIYVTSSVGCQNQDSLVLIPQGMMFQSDKGIWLLARDLSTQYIGAPVEGLVIGNTVTSATLIPETTQVRFTLNNATTLIYDYFYDNWGEFNNISALSSIIYNNLHTYINALGEILQETPGKYLDNGLPVLLSFTTGWIPLAGFQGYQRLYFFYLLGQYFSPFTAMIGICYDYNPTPNETLIINPINYSPPYGKDVNFGSGQPYGGQTQMFNFRCFVSQQRCTSFQIQFQEFFNSYYGTNPGQGLSLSGINCIIGAKKGYVPQPAITSV